MRIVLRGCYPVPVQNSRDALAAPGSAAPADLERDGFARLGRVLDDDVLPAIQAAVATLGADPARGPYGLLRHDPWRVLAPLEAEIRRGRLAERARGLLEVDEVVLFQDHVIWKPPHAPREVSWHQDHAYWPLDRPHGLTMWIALDDATVENGCLHYAPGSHLLGERCPTDFTPGTNQPRRADLAPIDVARADAVAVPVPLRAGEAVAHHPLVWHRSPGNSTARDRRGWSLSWVASDVRWDLEHAPHPYVWTLSPRSGEPLSPGRFPRFRRGP
jgi:phytanoyl-CoA hydroxylase